MDIQKITQYFKVQELVSEAVYKRMGDSAWNLFDPELLNLIVQVRELFNCSMVINTWHMDNQAQSKYGRFEWRGYRTLDCKVGSITGAHYKGQAVDFDLWAGAKRMDSRYITDMLIKHKNEFKALKGIEIADWVHIDSMVRIGQQNGAICVFNPAGFIRWA